MWRQKARRHKGAGYIGMCLHPMRLKQALHRLPIGTPFHFRRPSTYVNDQLPHLCRYAEKSYSVKLNGTKKVETTSMT